MSSGKKSKQQRIIEARLAGNLVEWAVKRTGYVTKEDLSQEEWLAVENQREELNAIRYRKKLNKVEERIRPQRLPKRLFVIYCDGCLRDSRGGIGVISGDVSILIKEEITAQTSNQVECLAAIRALEEARARGIRGVRLLSDSQLVVHWTDGAYQLKSETARHLVPHIRKLLEEVQGVIEWIPGTSNLAAR